ncbi:hypothetical protein [Spongiactinospora sp. TRM90649]|uniref:hypothetical protein n=1 Tax=Spongiactinospora sp. TRM90649 TaxID=3031114 RepID=UPI0023F6875F|nr:hypothetical protein [Spongiactinospora sp. TRM90649]MDF5758113.1 hypothetical protein [Spongiactinospora sp. TRM90649]
MTHGPDDLRPVDLFDEEPPLLDEQTRDDTDIGWGALFDDSGDPDDTARLLEERPPHWG